MVARRALLKYRPMWHSILLAAALAASAKSPAPKKPAVPKEHPGSYAFARELAQQAGPSRKDLSAKSIRATLAKAKYQQGIIDAISKPAEGKPWKAYRPIFLTEARIEQGVAFHRAEQAALAEYSQRYGVPAEIMVAIIGVETFYGRNTGKYQTLDALTTLAFYYPPRQAFFRDELKHYFLLQDKQLPNAIDKLNGSYAGAMGLGQFMPSSIAKYAVDGDEDGKLDLWQSRRDALASIGNYLVGHGWQRGEPIVERALAPEGSTPEFRQGVEIDSTVGALVGQGYALQTPADRPPATGARLLVLDGAEGPEPYFAYRNFYVLSRYNRSPLYCLAVTQLAEAIVAAAREEPSVAGQ